MRQTVLAFMVIVGGCATTLTEQDFRKIHRATADLLVVGRYEDAYKYLNKASNRPSNDPGTFLVLWKQTVMDKRIRPGNVGSMEHMVRTNPGFLQQLYSDVALLRDPATYRASLLRAEGRTAEAAQQHQVAMQQMEADAARVPTQQSVAEPAEESVGVGVMNALSDALRQAGPGLQAQRDAQEAQNRQRQQQLAETQRQNNLYREQRAEQDRQWQAENQRRQQQQTHVASTRKETRVVTQTINVPAHSGCIRQEWKNHGRLWTLELHNTCPFALKVASCYSPGCRPGQALTSIEGGGVARLSGHGERKNATVVACQLRSGKFDVVWYSAVQQCQTRIEVLQESEVTSGQR